VQSEYVADSEKRIAFLSSFTGSAGTIVVTLDHALLWTDGRYFNQATKQLSSEWTLMKSGLPEVPTVQDWLVKNMTNGQSVGADAYLMAAAEGLALTKALAAKDISLISVDSNPIDEMWGSNRPAPLSAPIFPHKSAFYGVSHNEKISKIRNELSNLGAESYLVTMLDEVMKYYAYPLITIP
jgi:Xaa-Pro aminopeptidase